jgi:hypothetical protein
MYVSEELYAEVISIDRENTKLKHKDGTELNIKTKFLKLGDSCEDIQVGDFVYGIFCRENGSVCVDGKVI